MFTKLLLAFVMLCGIAPNASLYKTVSSRVEFFAGTPVEDIEAVNEKAISFINIETGEVRISIPNAQFIFLSPLMQEHFNENYMETSKFPHSEFKGNIVDINHVDWKADVPQKVQVSGNLTIHGTSKQRTIDATIIRRAGGFSAEASFDIVLADHGIERPKILWEKLAEKVKVKSIFNYAPLHN